MGTYLRKRLLIFWENGIPLHEERCIFGAEEVIYLGHRMDRNKWHPFKKKVEVSMRAPILRSLQELGASSGPITYHGSFLLHITTPLPPLKKVVKWGWSAANSCRQAKETFYDIDLLVRWDPGKELVFVYDSSPDAFGAMFSYSVGAVTDT